jgi:hypothetical protein
MNTTKLNAFGITLTFSDADKAGASISSDMPAPDYVANRDFNSAVDGIESMILAHFCAGIDVSTPAYLEGIETAYEALCNKYDVEDGAAEDGSTMIITKNRRVKASVDEQFEYKVNTSDWNLAMEADSDEEIALERLKEEGKATRVHAESEVDEIFEEFECSVCP